MADDIRDWLEAHRIDGGALVSDDIVGIGHAMAELRSIAGRLRHPELVLAAGGELPRGLLLSSPAGTGKTTCARWLARSIGADIPTYELAADELTAPRVRELFGALAGVRSVVIIDEIDLVGLRRDMLTGSAQRVLRALLAALDGLASRAGPLIVAATTRSIWELDEALVRQGRLGIHMTLDFPTEEERLDLLVTMARGRALAPDIDWAPIAARSVGFTPAALRQALDDALGLSLADDRRETSQADLLTAIGRNGEIAPVVAPPSWWDRRREVIRELGRACVAVVLLGPGQVRAIRISHLPGSAGAFGIAGRPTEAIPDDELRALLAVGYGPLAAEWALLGSAAMGSADDVAQITRVLEARLAAGLDRSVPPVALLELHTRLSERLRTIYVDAIVREAQAALALAEAIVAANTGAIEAFARVFATTDELSGPALHAAIAAAGFRDASGRPIAPGLGPDVHAA